jgi:type III secretory pathway component EscV
VITDAREAASDDLARRQKRYFIAMAFRVACFVAMVFVPGWGRWVLLGIAVIIPTVAVTFANQADHRSPRSRPVTTATPATAPELTIGESDIIPGETVPDDEGDGPRMPGAA